MNNTYYTLDKNIHTMKQGVGISGDKMNNIDTDTDET